MSYAVKRSKGGNPQTLEYYLKKARKGPTNITQNGRIEFVILPIEQYNSMAKVKARSNQSVHRTLDIPESKAGFQGRDDQKAYLTVDLPDSLAKAIEKTEMSSKHNHLNALLDEE